MTSDPNPQEQPNSEGSTAPPAAPEGNATESTPVPSEAKAAAPNPPEAQPPATPAAKSPGQAPAASPAATKSTSDQLKAVAQVMWTQAKPVLKTVAVQALLWGNRGTNAFYERVLPMVIRKGNAAIPEDFKTKVTTKTAPVVKVLQSIGKVLGPIVEQRVKPLWAKALTALRQRLPQEAGELSDRFLNTALVLLVIWVWWLLSGLSPGHAQSLKPDLTFPEVKNKPVLSAPSPRPQPPSLRTAPTISPSPIVKAPTAGTTASGSAASGATTTDSGAPSPVKPTPSPVVVKPSPPPAPVVSTAPKTVAPSPEAKPPAKPVEPKPEATPLATAPKAPPAPTGPNLAEIQAELTAASDRLLETEATVLKQVKVPSDHPQQLEVGVSSVWYTLTSEQQDRLASGLYKKSQKLDFAQIRLLDEDGGLVARSPYVGDTMVMVRRSH